MMWKKYNEIQLTKNKMDLNNQKMKNHPPSPEQSFVFPKLLHFYDLFIIKLFYIDCSGN